MVNYIISKESKGGGCMVKDIPVESKVSQVPQVAPIPTSQQVAIELNKLSIKYNASNLMQQECTETLQKFIGLVMSTLNGLEVKNKELEEKLSELSKTSEKK